MLVLWLSNLIYCIVLLSTQCGTASNKNKLWIASNVDVAYSHVHHTAHCSTMYVLAKLQLAELSELERIENYHYL